LLSISGLDTVPVLGAGVRSLLDQRSWVVIAGFDDDFSLTPALSHTEREKLWMNVSCNFDSFLQR
jgi:hypothetical protein